MESTSIATSSSLKALKFNLTPHQIPTKPKLHKKPNHLSFLLRCSPKPHFNTNDQDSTFKPQTPKPTFVFDLGPENSWDSSDIGSPVVKRFLSDDEERWYMWYHGNSSSSSDTCQDSVGLAVSTNGVHWERGTEPVKSASDVGIVMSQGNDWWAFDTKGVKPAEIVIMSSSKVKFSSSVYWMYYTGLSKDEDSEKSMPGLAISQDGRYWARIEGDHHSGALFDDSLSIESPKVVFHEKGDLRMYYHIHNHNSDRKSFSIAIARSRDGIQWEKLGKVEFKGQSGNFDEGGALNPHVVKMRDGGGYLMAYEGVGPNGERRIGLAESEDGLKDWAKLSVLEAQQDGWDYGSPYLVEMEDEWRVYYRAVEKIGSQGRTRVGIGMATSTGSDVTKFTTWSGIHI